MISATAAASAATTGSSRNEVIDPVRGENHSPDIADHRDDAVSSIRPHQQTSTCMPLIV